MGMDLVPVYQAPESSGAITVSADAAKPLAFALRPSAKDRWRAPFGAESSFRSRNRRAGILRFRKTAGFSSVWWPSAGERVQRGAALFEVDVPAWAQDQEAWLTAKTAGDATLQAATAGASGARVFLRRPSRPCKGMEIQNPLVLRAPEAGLVTTVSANAGAFLKAGTPLLSLTGAEGLWLEVFFTAGSPEAVPGKRGEYNPPRTGPVLRFPNLDRPHPNRRGPIPPRPRHITEADALALSFVLGNRDR